MHSFPLRRIVSLLVWLFVFVSAIGLGGYFYLYQVYYRAALTVTVELPAQIDFQIEQGEAVRSVAVRLEERGVIRDSWVLSQYLQREGLDTQMEAGYFTFLGALTVPDIAARLLRGGAEQISFTILEGWNSTEIDTALAERGLIQPHAFSLFVREGGGTQPVWAEDRPVASLEGYLFPATYYLDPAHISVDSLVQRMVDEMERQLARAGFDQRSSHRTQHEILTMASIIELEERDPDSQPLVADILWRRLDAGWQLGADATLFYQLGHREHLTTADLAVDSPYNTRIHRGLPPTPVASPSASALTAAVHPQANDYWYYLHGSDGRIHFAADLAGHNANKAQYLGN